MGAVSEFIRELQAYEEFVFSRDEVSLKTSAPESSIKKELARLVSDNQIINIRKGFYIILPPRYQHYGKLPIELYVNKLFRMLNKQYYIGFFSAATFHGAAHQKIQQDYVITTPPALRNIAKENIRIRFFNIANWPSENIIQSKSDAGYFKLSSPVLTFADLIDNQGNLGGLSRIITVLEELSEVLELEDMETFLTWYQNKSVLQRMGYLLEKMGVTRDFTKMVLEHLRKKAFYPTLLSPRKEEKAGSTGNRWKVVVNTELESDL